MKRRMRQTCWSLLVGLTLVVTGACSGNTSSNGEAEPRADQKEDTSPRGGDVGSNGSTNMRDGSDASGRSNGGTDATVGGDDVSPAGPDTRDDTAPDTGGIDPTAQDLSCLDDVQWARADRSSLEYTGEAVEAFSDEALGNVTFQLCPNADDASCSNPVFSGTTKDDGTFTGTIPMGSDRTGFNGYARIGNSRSVYDTIVFFNPPITEESNEPVPLVTKSTFETFTQMTLGIEPNRNRGHLALEAVDCTWESTSDITFEVDAADEETTSAYLRGGMPDASARRTDGSGLVGFFNVPVGDVTVTAKGASTGKVLGRVEVFVEVQAISAVTVAPRPNSR